MGPREHGRKGCKGSSQRRRKRVALAECGKLQVGDRLVDIADELEHELESDEGTDADQCATSVGSPDQIAAWCDSSRPGTPRASQVREEIHSQVVLD